MGIFDNRGMGNVAPDKAGNYFKDGDHLVLVTKCKEDTNGQGQGIFVAECMVLETDNPEVTPGTKFDFVKNVGAAKYLQSTLGEIKSFLQAGLAALADANGEERPGDVASIKCDDEEAKFCVSPEGPLVGTFLKVKVWGKPTEGGGVYTKHKWDAAPDLVKARELAARVS